MIDTFDLAERNEKPIYILFPDDRVTEEVAKTVNRQLHELCLIAKEYCKLKIMFDAAMEE